MLPPRARFENELSKVVSDLVAPLRELLKISGVGAESVEKVRWNWLQGYPEGLGFRFGMFHPPFSLGSWTLMERPTSRL